MSDEQVLDLLNENEQLKQSLNNKIKSDDYWEQKANKRIQELENENKQLKQQLWSSYVKEMNE